MQMTVQPGQRLQANRANAEAILEALSRIGGRMDDVREAFAGFGDIDPGAADARPG